MVVLATLAVGVVAAATIALARSQHAGTAPVAGGSRSAALPTTIGNDRHPTAADVPLVVFYVDASGALIERTPGSSSVGATDVAGWPESPVSAGGQILYLSGGVVFEAGHEGPVFPSTALGRPGIGEPAGLTAVFGETAPGGPGQFWVTSRAGDPGESEADLFTLDGTTWSRSAGVRLPADEVVAGAFPSRLVTVRMSDAAVVERDATSGRVVRTLAGLATGDGEQLVTEVIGATNQETVLVACGRGPDCPLLIDSAAGARLVRPPAGTTRFIGGGAISSTGTVAAFAATTDASVAHLVLIDPATGAATLVPALVTLTGDAAGAAAWAPGGRWLAFGGPRQTYGLDTSSGSTFPLPIVAGYGFVASACC